MRNEIKELEPGMLFFGKSKKYETKGFGILLGPHKDKPQYWQVRCMKEDWPKLYEWVT